MPRKFTKFLKKWMVDMLEAATSFGQARRSCENWMLAGKTMLKLLVFLLLSRVKYSTTGELERHVLQMNQPWPLPLDSGFNDGKELQTNYAKLSTAMLMLLRCIHHPL